MGGADVKNYIRPYYRTGAALGQSAAVLPHQRPVLPQGPAVLPLLGAVLPPKFSKHDILHRHEKTEDAPKSQRKGGAKE